MRPPICAVCNARFSPGEGGGSLKFADFEPLPERMVGHPKGLEWVCGDHFEAAKALLHLPSGEAIGAVRQ